MRSTRELLVIPAISFIVVGVLFVQSALVFAEGGAVRVYTEDESAVKSNDTVTPSSGSQGSSGGSEPDTKSEGCTASVQKAADAGDKAAQQKCPKEKQGTVTYTTPEGTQVTCGKGAGALPECSTELMDAIIQDKGNAYYTTPDGEKTSLTQFKDQQLNSLKTGDYSALNDAFGKDDLESRIEGLEQQAQAIRDKGGDPSLVISADPKTLDAWKSIESWEGGPKPEQSIIEAIRKDGAVRMDIPRFAPSASAWTWDNTVGQFLGTFGGKTVDFGNGGFMSVSPSGQASFSFQNNPAGIQAATDFASARNEFIGTSGLFPNTFPQTSALIRDGSGLLPSQSSVFAPANINPFTGAATPPGIVLSPIGKDGGFMQWDPVQGKFVPIKDPTKLTPVDPNEPSSLIKTALKSPLLGENTDLKDFDKVAINDVPKVFDLEDGTTVAPGITTAPVQDEKLEALGISTERPTLNSIVETARESGGNAVARSLSLLERWGLTEGFTVRDFAALPTLKDFDVGDLPAGTAVVEGGGFDPAANTELGGSHARKADALRVEAAAVDSVYRRNEDKITAIDAELDALYAKYGPNDTIRIKNDVLDAKDLPYTEQKRDDVIAGLQSEKEKALSDRNRLQTLRQDYERLASQQDSLQVVKAKEYAVDDGKMYAWRSVAASKVFGGDGSLGERKTISGDALGESLERAYNINNAARYELDKEKALLAENPHIDGCSNCNDIQKVIDNSDKVIAEMKAFQTASEQRDLMNQLDPGFCKDCFTSPEARLSDPLKNYLLIRSEQLAKPELEGVRSFTERVGAKAMQNLAEAYNGGGDWWDRTTKALYGGAGFLVSGAVDQGLGVFSGGMSNSQAALFDAMATKGISEGSASTITNEVAGSIMAGAMRPNFRGSSALDIVGQGRQFMRTLSSDLDSISTAGVRDVASGSYVSRVIDSTPSVPEVASNAIEVAPSPISRPEAITPGPRFVPEGASAAPFDEAASVAPTPARATPSFVSDEGSLVTPQNIAALDEVKSATEAYVRNAAVSLLKNGEDVTPTRIAAVMDDTGYNQTLKGISENFGGMQFKQSGLAQEKDTAIKTVLESLNNGGVEGKANVALSPDVVTTLSRTPLSEWKDAVTLTPPQRLNKVVTDYLSNTAAEVSPKGGNFIRNFSAALAEPERAAAFTKAVRTLEQQTGKKFTESEISSALSVSRPSVEKEWAEMASAAGTAVPASTLLKRIQDSAVNTLAALTPDIAGKPLRSAVLAMQLLSTPLAPHIGTQTLGGALVRGVSIASDVLNPISSAAARELNTSGPFTRTGLAPTDAAALYAKPQATLATTYGFAGDAFNPSLRTSSGYMLDPNLLSAAHRELPLGSVVKVTNTENGKAVAVVINNRGELSPEKLIDLSPGAQAQLRGQSIRSVNNETTPVKYELVYVPPQTIANRYEKNPGSGTFKEMSGLTPAQSAAIVANPEAVKNLSFGAQGDLTPLARVQTTLASGDIVGASRAAVGNTPIRDVVKVLDTPPLGTVPTFKPATIEGLIVPVTKAAENIQALADVAQKAVLKAAEDMGASMITAKNVKTADDAVRALTQQAKEVEGALARLGAQSADHAPEALDALKQLRNAQTELKSVMNESLTPEAVNRAFAKVATEVDKSHAVVDVMAKSKGVTENISAAPTPQKLPERITAAQNITREIADVVSLPGRTLKQGEESLGQVVRQAQARAAQSSSLPTYKDFVALSRSSGAIEIPGVPKTIYLPGSEFSPVIPQRSFIVNHDQWGSNALARASTYHNGGVPLGTRYWVTRDGNVVIARRDGVTEAHVGVIAPADSSGRRLLNVTNANSTGIEFEGFGQLTKQQIESGLALNLFLQARHGIPPSNVVAHAKATGRGVLEGATITNIVKSFGHVPEKIASFLGEGIKSLGQTVRETGTKTAGWVSDNVRRVANTAQEQIRYVMKTDAQKTAAAQPKMATVSADAQRWIAENSVTKTVEPVRMAAARYGLPEGPIGYGIGMGTPAGVPSNVKVVFGPYIDTMPQFVQAARAQGITPAGYVNTVCQGSLCAGYVQAGKARLEVIGGHREFRFTDQATMLEYVGMQIDGMKQLGIRSADFDNLDGYAQSWVANVVDLANQKDFGVWLKNPNLMKGNVVDIVKKPNVVGFFVENDPTSTLGNLLKLRADANRPDVTVLFAGGHGSTGPWIRNLQAEVATGKYQNVAVSVGPAGEYQGVVATAWAPPAGSAQGVAGRATSLPVLPEKFHQEVKLVYPQSKGVEAQIWFNDGTNRFPITQEQLRTLAPEVAQAQVTVDVLFNNGIKNVPLAEAPKALENAFAVAAKAATPDARAVLGKNLIDKNVAPRGAPVTTASKNPLFKTETQMPVAFGDGSQGSAALRVFATPEYARGYAGMMAAVKEGKVPSSIKQVQGEPLVWSDSTAPRYQYRADVDGSRVVVTKIDTQGQKSLTPNSKLFQPQVMFETAIEKPQMGVVTVTKRTTDAVVAKGGGSGAVSGKDPGDVSVPATKPTDVSVTPPTPESPTAPLGPISIISVPGESAGASAEPVLSGWKKAAAVLTGVIAAPLAYLGIGTDSGTVPPAATPPATQTGSRETVVEETPVDVPAGLEGDGCATKVAADLGVNVECQTPAPANNPPPNTPPSQMPPRTAGGRGGDERNGSGMPGNQGQPQMPQGGGKAPQGGAPTAAGKPPTSGGGAGGVTPGVPGSGVNNGTTDKSLAQLTCPVATMKDVPFSVKWVCAPNMTSQGTGFSTGGMVSGFATTSITTTTTFGLACTGTGAAAATCTTRVIAPKTVLTAAPTEVDPGQKVVIAWVTTETTNCSLYGPQSILRSGGTANVHVIPSLTRSTEFALACGTTAGTTIKRTVVVRVRGSAGEVDPAVVPESDIRTTPVTDTPVLGEDSASSSAEDGGSSSNTPANTNPQNTPSTGGYTATDQNGNPVTLCDPMMGIYRFTQCLLKKPY
jgi:rare lipoprotein A